MKKPKYPRWEFVTGGCGRGHRSAKVYLYYVAPDQYTAEVRYDPCGERGMHHWFLTQFRESGNEETPFYTREDATEWHEQYPGGVKQVIAEAKERRRPPAKAESCRNIRNKYAREVYRLYSHFQ